MKTLALVATAIAVICGPASAQVSVEGQADPRFDLPALQGICSRVRANQMHAYERQVLAAARVGPDDSEAEMRSKVGALFRDHMPRCDGFNVSRGNIIKYAVAFRTYVFIDDAANVWQIDLNVPDESDGRTVLDYVLDELVKNIGGSAERELTSYRDMLIRAGARTTAQLEAGEDCRPSTRCRQ